MYTFTPFWPTVFQKSYYLQNVSRHIKRFMDQNYLWTTYDIKSLSTELNSIALIIPQTKFEAIISKGDRF